MPCHTLRSLPYPKVPTLPNPWSVRWEPWAGCTYNDSYHAK